MTGHTLKCRLSCKKSMKNRMNHWVLGVVLSALPLATGCRASGGTAETNEVPVLQVAASPTTNSTDLAEAEADASTNLVDLANAPVKPISTEQPIPANLNLSAPAAELVKLAQAGLDEGVMLAYVTNSASTFNLSADQIVYLNDVGVAASVVTAMIQQDQALKNGTAQPQPGAAAALAAAASGGTNTEPAASGPAPSEVAPQAEGSPAPAPTAPANVTYNTFYQSLAPYGSWVEVDGYGPVWRPTVVVIDPGWRPYWNSGRWIYTDAGWYWYSDYSWGWAPFHYGRWFQHSHLGWCWSPGYTWGPSWVSWRYNSAYCGWAPLPPHANYVSGLGFTYYGSSVSVGFSFGLSSGCYSFVPVGHFHSHRPYRYGVPPTVVNNIYNNTTVVNNYGVINNTVVNRGIPVDRVAAATGTRIPRVPLQTSTRPAAPNRADQFTGNRLVAYRPNLPKDSQSAPTRAANQLSSRPSRNVSGPAPGMVTPSSTTSIVPGAAARQNNPALARNAPTRSNLPGAQPGLNAQTGSARGALNPATPAVAPGSAPTVSSANRLSQRPQQFGNRPGVEAGNAVGSTSPRTGQPLILKGSGSGAGTTTATTPNANLGSIQARNSTVQSPAATANQTARLTPQRPASTFSTPSTTPAWNPSTTTSSSSRLNQRPQTSSGLQNSFAAPTTTPGPVASAPSFSPPQRYTPATPAPSQRTTPSYQAPQTLTSPRYTPAPSMSAPTPRYSAPSPSYNAPSRSVTPAAPSYSAPSRSMPPSPSYSAPSRSMPAAGNPSGNRMIGGRP